ncbi:MAG: hypothetical protein WBB28_23620, partial [Crinalium sp.]
QALIKTAFSSRKVYAHKWEGIPPVYPFIYRLRVNGYLVEVNYWKRWCPTEEHIGVRKYTHTTLAQEPIRALTQESLARLQQENVDESNLSLKRINPYSSDLIQLLFNETVDREAASLRLKKISSDYQAGTRGIGSRSFAIKSKLITSEFITVDELLIERGIDPCKYSRGGIIIPPGASGRMGLYIKCFSVDLTAEPQKNHNQLIYNRVYGILNHQANIGGFSQFDTVHLLASVDKKAWLLIEDYLKDFAIPATNQLGNGEGYVKKLYVSPRKYIAPAKVNIQIETINYSAWIPFGPSAGFPTFSSATEEIRKRLKDSGLPGLKITFKKETIEK